MPSKKPLIVKLLEKELNQAELSLFSLMSLEQRKDTFLFRMPKGVISLENLWERIKEIAEKNNIVVKQAPVYATLEELDDVIGDIEWLWPGWIPRGFVTMIAGDPGIGKTTVALGIVKIITSGDYWPNTDVKAKKEKVIWIDSEASQQILRTRSISLGIDRRMVPIPVINGDILGNPDFDSEADREYIAGMVDSMKPGLLVLDSLGGSNRKGENKVEEVRPLLDFLASMARDKNIGVAVLHHLRKPNEGASTEVSLYDLRGSTAIPAYCRSIIAVEYGKSEGEKKLRIIKSNLAIFRSSDAISILSDVDDKGNITKLNYSQYQAPPPKQTKKQQCADWVMETLKLNEKMDLKELRSQAKELGFSTQTLYDSRELLGDMVTVEGSGREVSWSLSIPEIDEESNQQIMDAHNNGHK